MKSKLKLIAAVAAFSVVISSFTACTVTIDWGNKTTTTVPTDEEQTEEVSRTAVKPTIQKTTTTTTTTAAPLDREEDDMEALLDLIKDFPAGTAGSTAKNVAISLRILNYLKDINETRGLMKDAKNFINALSPDEIDTFYENLGEVDYMVHKVAKDPDANIKNYINESGEAYDANGYDLEIYEELISFINDMEN